MRETGSFLRNVGNSLQDEVARVTGRDGADADRGEFPNLDCRRLAEQYFHQTDRGALIVGLRRQVLLINPAARELLVYDGRVPDALVNVVRNIEVEFAVGDALHDRRSVAYEAFAPNPDRLLRYQIVPIIGESAEPMCVVVSIDDVTRLRHLETVRRDFVANVSHELRTPLTSINLLVETLQHGALEDPEASAHFLKRIQVETHSMARLVEDLLSLSRLESGRLALNIVPTDLQESLEHVIRRLTPLASDKHLLIGLDIQPEIPMVCADPDRLEQCLMNLLHNAVKFTPSGGQVSVRASRQGVGVQVDVVDTGVGLDPADASRIFERFYKVDKGRNRAEGSGLGLAITRHLIELHGSQLHVVSEPERGARFSFALPIAK